MPGTQQSDESNMKESLRSAVVDDVPLDWLGGRGASITGRWSEAAEVTQSKATILVSLTLKQIFISFQVAFET